MQNAKYYAGIGSRETPREVCLYMTAIAKKLASLGYTCNSGGADGADSAFERGAVVNRQIFLPWDGFNRRTVANMIKLHGEGSYLVPAFNPDLVRKYHPKPDALSDAGWKFMSRNSYQVLGKDLNTPVEFVLCWTKDGKLIGGTSFAIRIAKDYNIPVFNLGTQKSIIEFKEYFRNLEFFS
jgi:hypothetical protein